MMRAGIAAAFVGLALALALPALHLTAAGPGVLIGRWWPCVLVIAGLRAAWRPALWYGRWLPVAVALVGLALLAGRLGGLPVGPLLLAALLLVAGLRLAGVRRAPARRNWMGLDWSGHGASTRRLVGDIHLGGPDWRVENSSIFQLAGEVHMDLTNARMPEGTTPLRIGMLAGEVEVTVPPEIGVRASARLKAGNLDLLGHRAEGVGPHLTVESDGYAQAQRRIDLTIEMVAGEVRVRRWG